MTLSLRVPGASFTKTVLRAKPAILSEADLYLLLGGDEISSVENRNGGTDAAVVGTPIYKDGYCTLNASNGFQAPIAAAGQPFTYVGVFSPAPTSDTVVYLGNWTASTPRHAISTANTSLQLRIVVDGAVRASAAALSSMQFVGGSHDGSRARLYLGKGGSVTKTEAVFAGGAQTSVFRAGGTGTGGGYAYDMAAAIYWKDILSDGEIEEVYEYLLAALSLRGVTIL